jgi:hypothetical protein
MSSQPTKIMFLTAIATSIVLVIGTTFGAVSVSSSPQAQGTLTPWVYLPAIYGRLPAPPAPPNTWSPAASMTIARYGHTPTLLPSGGVLVAGGNGSGGARASAELYDPGSNTWSPVASMSIGRYFHTATLLSSGKVLVVGGSSSGALASAELYDRASNTWSPAASMTIARSEHTATLLSSGKVLVAGGADDYNNVLASAELYNP